MINSSSKTASEGRRSVRPKFRPGAVGRVWAVLLCLTLLLSGNAFSLHVQENTGSAVYSDNGVTIDASNVDGGTVSVCHTPTSRKLMTRVQCASYTDTYILDSEGSYCIFPLHGGSGSYTVSVFENVSGNDYAQTYSTSFSASMADENICYIYPNRYVSFTASSPIVETSEKICEGCADEKEIINKVWKFMCTKMTYDYIKSLETVKNYIPNAEETLSTHKGICFDLSSLTCALLRVQDIPARMVTGKLKDTGEYHAWVQVLVGGSWLLLDPTQQTSGNDANYISDHYY